MRNVSIHLDWHPEAVMATTPPFGRNVFVTGSWTTYSAHSHLSDNRGLAERKILQLLRIFFWEETRQKNAIDVENKF